MLVSRRSRSRSGEVPGSDRFGTSSPRIEADVAMRPLEGGAGACRSPLCTMALFMGCSLPQRGVPKRRSRVAAEHQRAASIVAKASSGASSGRRSGPSIRASRHHSADACPCLAMAVLSQQCGLKCMVLCTVALCRNRRSVYAAQDAAARILDALRFPEPCGQLGLQPSPKHILGGPVRDVAPTPSPAAHVAPATCPTCRSTLVVTKAKSPDADSYWRCTSCGEVWNAARIRTGRPSGGYRWR